MQSTVCLSKKLTWRRQCTTPILNGELGLGPRVTLFWKLYAAPSNIWVWLSLNGAIIIIILTAVWLILKEVEWLCPVHPGKEGQNEPITWRQGSDLGLFAFLCPVLVLHSLGPWVISILSCFFKRSINCDGVADKAGLDSPGSVLEVVCLVIGLIHGKTIVMRNVTYHLNKG